MCAWERSSAPTAPSSHTTIRFQPTTEYYVRVFVALVDKEVLPEEFQAEKTATPKNYDGIPSTVSRLQNPVFSIPNHDCILIVNL